MLCPSSSVSKCGSWSWSLRYERKGNVVVAEPTCRTIDSTGSTLNVIGIEESGEVADTR